MNRACHLPCVAATVQTSITRASSLLVWEMFPVELSGEIEPGDLYENGQYPTSIREPGYLLIRGKPAAASTTGPSFIEFLKATFVNYSSSVTNHSRPVPLWAKRVRTGLIYSIPVADGALQNGMA